MISMKRLRNWLNKATWNWNSPVGTMTIRGLGLAVNFGVLALVARWSSQESLGVVVALTGAAFFGGVVCSFGIPTLLLKSITSHVLRGEPEIAAADYRKGTRIAMIATLIGCIALAATGIGQVKGYLPATFGALGPVELFALAFCSLGMVLLFLGISAIRALKQPALSGVFQFLTQPVLIFATFALLHWFQIKIAPSIAAMALIAPILLNGTVAHLYVLRRLPMSRVAKPERMPWDEIRSLWFLSVLSAATGTIPILLAAVLLAPAAVAALGVPFRICNLPMTVVAALGAYYSPLIREAHLRKDYLQQKKELVESQWIGAILVLPVLLIAFFAPDFVLGLFGIRNALANELLLLFSCSQFVIASCGVCEQYLIMLDRTQLASRYTFWAIVAILTGSLLLARPFAAMGIGLGWAVFAVLKQLALRALCRSVR